MTTWKLTGITASKGSCDHCGRNLSRLFRVVTPEGQAMIVGRSCSAKLTGYNWTVAQAERTEAIRLGEIRAAEKYGDLWAEVNRIARDPEVGMALGYRAAQAQIMLRDERERWMSDNERIAFVRGLLAATT